MKDNISPEDKKKAIVYEYTYGKFPYYEYSLTYFSAYKANMRRTVSKPKKNKLKEKKKYF